MKIYKEFVLLFLLFSFSGLVFGEEHLFGKPKLDFEGTDIRIKIFPDQEKMSEDILRAFNAVHEVERALEYAVVPGKKAVTIFVDRYGGNVVGVEVGRQSYDLNGKKATFKDPGISRFIITTDSGSLLESVPTEVVRNKSYQELLDIYTAMRDSGIPSLKSRGEDGLILLKQLDNAVAIARRDQLIVNYLTIVGTLEDFKTKNPAVEGSFKKGVFEFYEKQVGAAEKAIVDFNNEIGNDPSKKNLLISTEVIKPVELSAKTRIFLDNLSELVKTRQGSIKLALEFSRKWKESLEGQDIKSELADQLTKENGNLDRLAAKLEDIKSGARNISELTDAELKTLELLAPNNAETSKLAGIQKGLKELKAEKGTASFITSDEYYESKQAEQLRRVREERAAARMANRKALEERISLGGIEGMEAKRQLAIMDVEDAEEAVSKARARVDRAELDITRARNTGKGMKATQEEARKAEQALLEEVAKLKDKEFTSARLDLTVARDEAEEIRLLLDEAKLRGDKQAFTKLTEDQKNALIKVADARDVARKAAEAEAVADDAARISRTYTADGPSLSAAVPEASVTGQGAGRISRASRWVAGLIPESEGLSRFGTSLEGALRGTGRAARKVSAPANIAVEVAVAPAQIAEFTYEEAAERVTYVPGLYERISPSCRRLVQAVWPSAAGNLDDYGVVSLRPLGRGIAQNRWEERALQYFADEKIIPQRFLITPSVSEKDNIRKALSEIRAVKESLPAGLPPGGYQSVCEKIKTIMATNQVFYITEQFQELNEGKTLESANAGFWAGVGDVVKAVFRIGDETPAAIKFREDIKRGAEEVIITPDF